LETLQDLLKVVHCVGMYKPTNSFTTTDSSSAHANFSHHLRHSVKFNLSRSKSNSAEVLILVSGRTNASRQRASQKEEESFNLILNNH